MTSIALTRPNVASSAAGQTGVFQSGMRFESSSRASTPLNVRSISRSLIKVRRRARDGVDLQGKRYSQRRCRRAFSAKILLPFLMPPGLNSAVFAAMDNLIEAREVQIERKHFHVEFRENDRGKFLRITEEAHGRRNTIIVPSTGVDEFTSAIDEVIEQAERAPA